jgi:hypothetical protein
MGQIDILDVELTFVGTDSVVSQRFYGRGRVVGCKLAISESHTLTVIHLASHGPTSVIS